MEQIAKGQDDLVLVEALTVLLENNHFLLLSLNLNCSDKTKSLNVVDEALRYNGSSVFGCSVLKSSSCIDLYFCSLNHPFLPSG